MCLMNSDYSKSLMKDYQKLILQQEKLIAQSKEQNNSIKELTATTKNLSAIIIKKDIQIEKLVLEIERLKNNNDKDSSNSGKPSSKNGFKKVTNSREKTGKKPGGQNGHKGSTTKVSNIKKLIENGEAKHVVIDVNKDDNNKDQPFRTRYVQDIEIKTVIKEYRYYPDANNIYHIPKEQNNIVTYGENIKAVSMLLVHKVPASMDQSVMFLNAISQHTFDISKSTLVNWSYKFSDSLEDFLETVKQGLYNAYYINTDESPIVINGETYQLHSYSNEKLTLQYVHKSKSKEAIEEIGFLPNYMGISVHDHNSVQYNYGIKHAECNTHILRYLKGVMDFTSHTWAKKMSDLLKNILHEKHLLEEEGKDKFETSDLESYSQKYDDLIKKGSKEYQKDYDHNAYKDEERRLITRMEDYKDPHLLFMYDFKIPFTNNRAEADIRPAKRKINIGIFRSEKGAKA